MAVEEAAKKEKKTRKSNGHTSQCAEEWATEERLDLIRAWARAGLTLKVIAANMKIGYSTLKVWKKDNEAIGKAIEESKEIANFTVENTLYKTANGFKIELKEPIKLKHSIFSEVTGKKIEEHETVGECMREIYVQPNANLIMYWLNNRARDRWQKEPGDSSTEEMLQKAIELLGGVKSAF